jgi:hypothetical protein
LIRSRLTSTPSRKGFMRREVTNRSERWARSSESESASPNNASHMHYRHRCH